MKIKLDKKTNNKVRKMFIEATTCEKVSGRLIKQKKYEKAYEYEKKGIEISIKAWDLIYKKYPEMLGEGMDYTYYKCQGMIKAQEKGIQL